MNTNTKLSKKQISEQIIAGMGLVYNLFNEMHSFFRLLVESLDSSDLDIVPLRSKIDLPHAKKRRIRNAADDYVRTDMGFLAELGATTLEDDEAEESEEEIEAEFDRKGLLIVPDSKFLAVRAVLYDPKKGINKSFEPYVVGAVLSRISAAPRRRALKKSGSTQMKRTQFNIKKRREFFRLMSRLEQGIEKGQEISWPVTKYELTAKISGIETRSLAAFDTEEKFNEFVQEIITIAKTA